MGNLGTAGVATINGSGQVEILMFLDGLDYSMQSLLWPFWTQKALNLPR